MIVRAAIAQLLERVYDDEPNEIDWLEGVRESAGRALEGHFATQAYTLRINPDRSIRFGHIAGDPQVNDLMLRVHEVASPADVSAIYLSGPTPSSTRALVRSRTPRVREVMRANMSTAGFADVFGAVGVGTDGDVCAVTFLCEEAKIGSATRRSLRQVAAHLGTAYRLRRASAVARAPLAVEDDDAPTSVGLRSRLRETAKRIDAAKRTAEHDPAAALASWQAMVDGRFSLVERTESDGRKLWLACENAPRTRELRQLTEVERKIVALICVGSPQKLVAYTLGFSESLVSKQLASAMGKLGVSNRAELLELHGALVGELGKVDA